MAFSIALRSLLIASTALRAAKATDDHKLHAYFGAAIVGTVIAFIVLTLGYGIDTNVYGVTDTVCRLVSLTAATGYVIKALGKRRVLLLYLAPALPFWLTIQGFYSASYYVKLAIVVGTSFAILGIALVAVARSTVNIALGSLWIAEAIWHFGFGAFVDRYMTWWNLDEWLPTAIVAIGFIVVGTCLRKQKPRAIDTGLAATSCGCCIRK
jgi:hypothetical protein